jgi:hypothetical protein
MAIINTVGKAGGRFLRFNEKENIFYEVDPNYRYEKVSHSLRSFKTKSRKSQKLMSDYLEPLPLTNVDFQMEHFDPTMLGSVLNNDQKGFSNANYPDKRGAVASESSIQDYEPINDFQSADVKLDEKIVDLLRQL